jgi:hypothetical protein
MTKAIVFGLALLALAFQVRTYVEQAEAGSQLRNHPKIERCAERHPQNRVGERAPLIWCIAHAYNSPGSPRYAIAIAHCESGTDLQDVYGGDGYIGTFQHITSAWLGRWRSWGARIGVPSSATNVLSQAVVSVRMAISNGTWSRQWSCA